MTQRLKDKVAVITGAASGIGRASVLRLLNEGARVVANDINEDALQALAQEVGDDAAKMTLKSGSVTQRSDVESIIDCAVAQFGRLDILVNSAGITPRTVRPEADFEERWEAVMAVNAKGTMLMCHAAVDAMRQSGGGAIINVASIMSLVSYPTSLPFSDGFSAYPQSKGTVLQLTRDLGIRVAQEGVRVNAVCPGAIETAIQDYLTKENIQQARKLTPLHRFGTPQDIAQACVFFASDDASWITGVALPVDGGWTARP